MRNAFNYVYFPIADPNNPTEVGKILTFKDHELSERRRMIGEMTSLEYKEYLENTEERPELQEIKRLDYIETQQTAKSPRVSGRTVPHTDEDLEDKVDKNLINSEIMREIDLKIGEFVSKKIEGNNLILDADVKLKLEEIREKRKLLDAEYLKMLEKNPEMLESSNEDGENKEFEGIENEDKNLENDKGKIKLIERDGNEKNFEGDFNKKLEEDKNENKEK